MKELIEKLRSAAESHPLDIDLNLLSLAANEIERLSRVENIVNNAPEVEHCFTDEELNKIKAEAVREAGNIFKSMPRTIAKIHGDKILKIADKLERGEA